MIISMTGFGSVNFENDNLVVFAEVKSLNSKFLDINFRLPRYFAAEKELELRNMLKEKLVRGKINVTLDFQYKNNGQPQTHINREILKSHYFNIQEVANELGATQQDILRLAMLMPDVISQDLVHEETSEEDWTVIMGVFEQALNKCIDFRKSEGKALETNFADYTKTIDTLLQKVIDRDPKRIETIKERIQTRIKELQGSDMFDANRFEQEMIYYIEKLDITEEKVRLKNHLDYFLKTLLSGDSNDGKKLNFISQEIGREINTIGSKANDAEIQRYVVEMKDELEKIKEQSLNVL